MNPQQLIELASLDAFGLLDEQERKAFETAFAAAPDAVKAQVRAQQSRMAEMDHLLPQVQPAPTLRQRVIDAVMAAAGQATPQRDVIGRIEPSLMPSRTVSPVWRVLAIGSIAAAIAFGFALVQFQNQQKELETAIKSDEVMKYFIKDFGNSFEQALMSNKTEFIKFDVASGAKPGAQAVLLLDPATKTGQFFCRNLPADLGEYQLSVVTPGGQTGDVVLTFQATTGHRAVENIAGLSIPVGSRLVLKAASPDAAPVLQSMSL